jgi:hypothetical protein
VATGEAVAMAGGEEAVAQPEPALEVVVAHRRSRMRSQSARRR